MAAGCRFAHTPTKIHCLELTSMLLAELPKARKNLPLQSIALLDEILEGRADENPENPRGRPGLQARRHRKVALTTITPAIMEKAINAHSNPVGIPQ